MITGRDEWKKLIPACCICRNDSIKVALMPAGTVLEALYLKRFFQ